MATEATYNTLICDLRTLVDEQVRPCYKWYSWHKILPRILFRFGGMVVVMGSLALPVIASSHLTRQGLLLTIVSLSVAVFSSLNAFFHWDGSWRSRTRTAYSLQGMLARWEFRIKSAEFADRPTTAALEATETLFNEAFALVGSETDEFFSVVKWPEAPKPPGA